MKHIVEYKLHAGHVPYFIEDGGYFKIGGKLIGITKDHSECYLPLNTLITFTPTELKKHLGNKVVTPWLQTKGFK